MISYAGVFQSEIIRSFGKENTVPKARGGPIIDQKVIVNGVELEVSLWSNKAQTGNKTN